MNPNQTTKASVPPILAIDGGTPVRKAPLPYGQQEITQSDIDSVSATLKSPWLTTGPKVAEFEKAFAQRCGTRHAIAVNSGTAALHCALFAVGIEPGDEVILSPLSFVASSNAVLYLGGTPVFVDVDPETLLIDAKEIEKKITRKTKAILAVDYAGQPCAYEPLQKIAEKHDLWLVTDACHSLGGEYQGRAVGSLSDISAFSFHPVKHITTGEGGMISTDDPELDKRVRAFRNHGILTEYREREKTGAWQYEMQYLGFNYRLTDLQCALGLSQLNQLESSLKERYRLATCYDQLWSEPQLLIPLKNLQGEGHAYHLYVVKINPKRWQTPRDQILRALRAEGINVNVHYEPIYLHPYYRTRFGFSKGICPIAEECFQQLLTLPLFPTMGADAQKDVVTAVQKVWSVYGK